CVVEAKLGGRQGDPAVEGYDPALVQQGSCLERRILPTLLHDTARDLHQHDRRYQQVLTGLNRRGKPPRVRAGREVFQPRRRVDDVHTRSASRGTLVSMPLRNPRMARMERTGMNSMRFWYCSACTF